MANNKFYLKFSSFIKNEIEFYTVWLQYKCIISAPLKTSVAQRSMKFYSISKKSTFIIFCNKTVLPNDLRFLSTLYSNSATTNSSINQWNAMRILWNGRDFFSNDQTMVFHQLSNSKLLDLFCIWACQHLPICLLYSFVTVHCFCYHFLPFTRITSLVKPQCITCNACTSLVCNFEHT